MAIPRVEFIVNKYVNLFYHLCVLFSEYLSEEQTLGFLNNQTYRQRHERLKTEMLHRLFRNLYCQSHYAWDFVGKSLSEASTMTEAKEALRSASRDIVETWLEIYIEAIDAYEDIWLRTEQKLKEYTTKFSKEWQPINEEVLTRMSTITGQPWSQNCIRVNFVDCLHGASAWLTEIALPPFPDIDVQKKLFSHELAHTLIPDYVLRTKLKDAGLDGGISHTIVDLIAFFSIRKHVTDPNRRGIKPNPDYYPELIQLYPVFEKCSMHADRCSNFDDVLDQIRKSL